MFLSIFSGREKWWFWVRCHTQMHMKIFRTRKIWRVSYVSVQEFFEFHMKQKQVIFKCFSLQALLIFQKEEEKVRCIQSPLCKRNWVTIPEHLCRLVSSPMVDSYAKTYHTILGSLQSSIILPWRCCARMNKKKIEWRVETEVPLAVFRTTSRFKMHPYFLTFSRLHNSTVS